MSRKISRSPTGSLRVVDLSSPREAHSGPVGEDEQRPFGIPWEIVGFDSTGF